MPTAITASSSIINFVANFAGIRRWPPTWNTNKSARAFVCGNRRSPGFLVTIFNLVEVVVIVGDLFVRLEVFVTFVIFILYLIMQVFVWWLSSAITNQFGIKTTNWQYFYSIPDCYSLLDFNLYWIVSLSVCLKLLKFCFIEERVWRESSVGLGFVMTFVSVRFMVCSLVIITLLMIQLFWFTV